MLQVDVGELGAPCSSVGRELSVVVPTFNEAENIRPLYSLLRTALDGIDWEVVFVDDDSTDQTYRTVRELAGERDNVRVIHRVGRRGLSTAVVEGMLSTSSPFVAVMDSDLQHDETLLAGMLAELRTGRFDAAIGSRYMEGGGIGDWSRIRHDMSRVASSISRRILKANLSDPMSGFFMVRREVIDDVVRDLSGEGFKILLDIFASSRRPLSFVELPYEFRVRQHGESKMDGAALWGYLMLLTDKSVGRYIPTKLLMFCLVGFSGLLVHFLILSVLFKGLALSFTVGQTVATLGAMTTNYAFNNAITFRERSRRGWRFLSGLASFYAVCSIGLFANVGVARAAFYADYRWWAAAIAGVAVGTVWNYAATSMFVWGGKK